MEKISTPITNIAYWQNKLHELNELRIRADQQQEALDTNEWYIEHLRKENERLRKLYEQEIGLNRVLREKVVQLDKEVRTL